MLMPYSAIKKQILLFAYEEPGVLVEGYIGFYAQNIRWGNIHLCHLHRQMKQHRECIKLSVRRDVYIDAQDFYNGVSKRSKLPTWTAFLGIMGVFVMPKNAVYKKVWKLIWW